MGLFGKIKVQRGETTIVELPTHIIEKMSDVVDMQDGIVDPEVVQRELGISKKTMANYVADGTIPNHMYIEAVNGKKKFFIYLILGWANKKMPWRKTGKYKKSA
jgi:hypothetical protein